MADIPEKWLEKAITDGHINYLEYNKFTNPKMIGIGGFGEVFKCEWKDCEFIVALKCLKVDTSIEEKIVEDFIDELKLLRKVSSHQNVITFHGVTKDSNGYYNMHSNNILIHQKQPKISDFGLSKLIDETSRTSKTSNSIVHGMAEYIEPQCFVNDKYKRNMKSDVYSLGVIFWEISSGRPPFHAFQSRDSLVIHIFKGNREEPIEGTPSQYIELYKKCWDNDPTNRPETKLVLNTLKQLILMKL
ncbi:kinase-like protein [Gigaspora margarita]|uniref:Kinase-like protein n=1 Tax=Gigaspora margarita TaxID=4874 RepID=A0A8H3X3K0_GIGMA|nr:kinase-like protein [Gigaspora margarita]